jgi:hypothetical protein
VLVYLGGGGVNDPCIETPAAITEGQKEDHNLTQINSSIKPYEDSRQLYNSNFSRICGRPAVLRKKRNNVTARCETTETDHLSSYGERRCKQMFLNLDGP